MLKLGIIGTNWITNQFVDAAIETKKYQLTAVYSRKEEKAREFGEPYKALYYFSDLKTFVESKEIDVVYIASPNSLHFEQAKAAILASKHVIVEKPAFSTVSQMNEIIQLATEKNVYFFEAARNIHESSFQVVRDSLDKIGDVVHASFTFMKYSSRYDAVLRGEEPNIFSTRFSGGAVMDLGIYLIYAALEWFGVPDFVHYQARKIATGVDGSGVICFHYPTFDVTMLTGKIADSFLPSEIQGTQGTLVMNAINSIDSIRLYDRNTQEWSDIPCSKKTNPMVEEANDFAEVIQQANDSNWQKKYQKWLQLAIEANKILVALRKDAEIVFTADQDK